MPEPRPQPGRKLFLKNADIAYRAIIGSPRTFGRNVSRRNNVNLMPQMIERQQPVKEHEHAVGKRKIIFGMLADVLQLPHDIVAAITDGSGGEGGQSRHGCGTVLSKQLFCGLQCIGLTLLFALATMERNLVSVRFQPHVRLRSQKCVAADLLTALDGLQQKSIRLSGGNGEKGRYRSKEVRRNRFHNRHQRALTRETRKLPVIGMDHLSTLKAKNCSWMSSVHYREERL